MGAGRRAITLKPLPATSPSTHEQLRACPLHAGLAHNSTSYDYVLDNPAAWLGTASHEVLAQIVHEQNQLGIDEKIASFWDDAIRKLHQKAQTHPLNRRFGTPTSWPRYHAIAAMTANRAHETARSYRRAARPGQTNILEHRLRAFENKLVGRPDAIRGGIIVELKTGSLHADPDDEPTGPKESYVRQLRLYAVLVHENFGWWPRRGVLVPLAGNAITVELSPSQCAAEADHALSLLDRYNEQLRQHLNVSTTPTPASCKPCPFKLVCNAFWKSIDTAWPDLYEGQVIEGRIASPPTPIQGGAAIALNIAVKAGNEAADQITIAPCSPHVNDCLQRLKVHNNVRIVGLRRRPDGSLAPSIRTVIARTEELPAIIADPTILQSTTQS